MYATDASSSIFNEQTCNALFEVRWPLSFLTITTSRWPGALGIGLVTECLWCINAAPVAVAYVGFGGRAIGEGGLPATLHHHRNPDAEERGQLLVFVIEGPCKFCGLPELLRLACFVP